MVRKGRGGARQGAGRKPALSARQQLQLGAMCAAKERERLARQNSRELAEKLALHEIEENYENIQSIFAAPLKDDPGGGTAREIVSYWGSKNRTGSYPDDLPDALIDAIEAMRGNAKVFDSGSQDQPPLGRVFTPNRTRLKEFLKSLFDVVAREAGQRFGVAVSPRMVETAWKEYRKLEKEIRADWSPLCVRDDQANSG